MNGPKTLDEAKRREWWRGFWAGWTVGGCFALVVAILMYL